MLTLSSAWGIKKKKKIKLFLTQFWNILDANTYECKLWTLPSIWADGVRFSNLISPEYIFSLYTDNTYKMEINIGLHIQLMLTKKYVPVLLDTDIFNVPPIAQFLNDMA